MEWLDKMNDAIRYIEAHIEDKMDYTDVAHIACCSLSRFQRMFTFVTDITLAEYVRNRRMSLSAKELISSDIRVIDLAMKYGYESPEAFTRVFHSFHGISPTTARKLGMFNDYPPISFEIRINGGNFNMGTKPIVRIEEHSMERVVSFNVNCQAPEEAALNLLRNWVTKNIGDYKARTYLGCAPKGHHPEGEEHHSNEEIGSHEYLAQMVLFENEGASGKYFGADVCDGPKGLFLIGDVVMNEFNDDGTIDVGSSMMKSFGVMSDCLREMGGYEFELNSRPYYEEHIFTNEWFSGNEELAGFKLWLPIKKV